MTFSVFLFFFGNRSSMVSPRFIPSPCFISSPYSVVRSPQSVFYTAGPSPQYISYRKEKSNRHLAMKVLEPIHLHTAGSVQACQHLSDLFTCRSHVLLSVQSPTEAVRCTFPKHSLSKPQGFIDRRQHYHC